MTAAPLILILRTRLALGRFGWMRALACLLCGVAIVAWSAGLPWLRRQAVDDQRELANAVAMAQAPQAALPVQPRDPLADFHAMLGNKRHANEQLRTLFALAQKNGLQLSAAEYRSVVDKNSGVLAWQIVLPVKATYPALRQFAGQALLAIPFASLDEVRLQRESIASPILDARLRFTLYLAVVPAAAPERLR
ncbi:hypothetical protein [Actimicrobium antarcticum]|uniref:Type II secretion system (T2SS), protein M subtype b n=1 Tax=Actimicrobium antarcticum TaxID=1051899 RepID=A0ABP7TSW4_9BURK